MAQINFPANESFAGGTGAYRSFRSSTI